MALQLGADAETIQAYAVRQQTSLRTSAPHPSTLRLLTFDAVAGERLVRFLRSRGVTARSHRLAAGTGG